jgi:hypothetical protein
VSSRGDILVSVVSAGATNLAWGLARTGNGLES